MTAVKDVLINKMQIILWLRYLFKYRKKHHTLLIINDFRRLSKSAKSVHGLRTVGYWILWLSGKQTPSLFKIFTRGFLLVK